MPSTSFQTPTEEAMDALKESMAQKRADSVEEIKDGFRKCIAYFSREASEKYIITDRQTGQSLDWAQLDLTRVISGSDWWHYEIIELLKLDEDDALERMSWIVQPDLAAGGCAPENRFRSIVSDTALSAHCPPVGRDNFIEMVEELGNTSLAQAAVLRRAINYLQHAPAAVTHGNVAQEAERIAKVQQFLHDRWAGQIGKARYIYNLLMRGRGSGVDDLAMVRLQSQVAHMELSE